MGNNLPWNAIGGCLVDLPGAEQFHLHRLARPNCRRLGVAFVRHLGASVLLADFLAASEDDAGRRSYLETR